MTVLAIDTSTAQGSVAVLENGRSILRETFLAERTHTAMLFTFLERARDVATHIDRIAVGLGPGSYAGVRISIAAAMGLQMSWKCEVVGIPSVAAFEVTDERYIAIGDARRETYYFTSVNCGECTDGPLLLSAATLSERLRESPGTAVFSAEVLSSFPDAAVALPSAHRLATLAGADRGIVMRNDLDPIYLREPHITLPKARK